MRINVLNVNTMFFSYSKKIQWTAGKSHIIPLYSGQWFKVWNMGCHSKCQWSKWWNIEDNSNVNDPKCKILKVIQSVNEPKWHILKVIQSVNDPKCQLLEAIESVYNPNEPIVVFWRGVILSCSEKLTESSQPTSDNASIQTTELIVKWLPI